jgi:hypothetical protein
MGDALQPATRQQHTNLTDLLPAQIDECVQKAAANQIGLQLLPLLPSLCTERWWLVGSLCHCYSCYSCCCCGYCCYCCSHSTLSAWCLLLFVDQCCCLKLSAVSHGSFRFSSNDSKDMAMLLHSAAIMAVLGPPSHFISCRCPAGPAGQAGQPGRPCNEPNQSQSADQLTQALYISKPAGVRAQTVKHVASHCTAQQQHPAA